jgi:hypothetical protein
MPALAAGLLLLASQAGAFEGRITAASTRGTQTAPLLYTVGTNQLRIEVTATNRPHPVNLVDLSSGTLTLLFPHNRSFVRLKPAREDAAAPFPGAPGMPLPPSGLPPGIGPQSAGTPTAPVMPNLPTAPHTPAPPAGIGPTNLPGVPVPPAMPQMPAPLAGLPPGIGPQPSGMSGIPGPSGLAPGMPPMPMRPMGIMEKAELKATGQKTNLLGFACARYELKQRGEVMEIWATDQLFPFQAYQQNQPRRFRPLMLEEQWPGLLKARQLFPLLVTLRFENGSERYRFEVKSIRPDKVADLDGQLFQPPPGYLELEPLPF